MHQPAQPGGSAAEHPDRPLARQVLASLRSWFDAAASQQAPPTPRRRRRVHWARATPFLFLHVGCLAVVLVGWSPTAVAVCMALLLARIFFVTAFYHRYFSHRAFRTSRAAQFVFAVLGNTAAQRGPLWWAAHHRHHHRTADRDGDPHSPQRAGLLWSHIGWLMDPANYPTRMHLVPDLAVYGELRWLDRFDTAVVAVLVLVLWGLGAGLEALAPSLGTSGGQLVVWGFFVSTVALFHVTSLVNSGAHSVGRKRFIQNDESRNSFFIALLTFGEGWHNNHHRFPGAARQGFYWWEIDVTYYLLRLLAATGIIWDLRQVPRRVLEDGAGRRSEQPTA